MNDRLSIIESLETFIPQDRPSIDFDLLYPPCRILNLLTMQDVMQLNYIAKDRRLAGRPVEKQNRIKQIMTNRGFKKLAAGTNRLVFKYMEDQSFVIKVPFNAVGLRDNLDELYNQQYLKPFCTKVFEVSPCGTVGMFERVHGIRNREEFQLVSSTIFDIIINKFIGQFVLADFGTKFFMNWGIRKNTYPVLLDFPYLYELDGAKIYCNRPDPLSEHGFCGGEIDYDNGFNHLVCKKCGKTYLASELRLSENKKSKDILIEREDIGMIVRIIRGNDIIQEVDTTKESDYYRRDNKGRRKETPLEYRERKACEGFKASIITIGGDDNEEQTATPEPKPASPTIDEFNHNYSLNSIPNDLDQMYRMQASIVTTENKRKNKEQKKALEPVAETIEPNVEVVEPVSRQMYEMAQQIHERNMDAYTDTPSQNNEELQPEEESHDQERDLHLQTRDEVETKPIDDIDREVQDVVENAIKQEGWKDFDDNQTCGTNLGGLLQDATNGIQIPEKEEIEKTTNELKDIAENSEEPAITAYKPERPANREVIIEPRDDTPDIISDGGDHINEAFYD